MRHIMIILLLATTCCGSIDKAADEIISAIDHYTDEMDNNETTVDDVGEVEETEEGSIIITSNIPDDRVFLGTFEKRYAYKACDNFPEITRLYSYDDYIYIENNRQELLAMAIIFQDLTFDFDFEAVSVYGTPYETIACTCNYADNQWYGDGFECSCEGDETICSLNYRQYD